MKFLIRVVMGLVALAAAALSFQSLMHLGQLCGYGALSFAYPLTLDLGAVASCAAWIQERNKQALGMTWVMLAISVVLNGTVHYLDTEGTAPSWLLVVLVAAVPPAVLGLVVHLAVGVRAPAVEGLSPVTITELPVESKTPVTEVELVEKVRAFVAENPDAGRPTIARELGITQHQARKALALTNGHANDTP